MTDTASGNRWQRKSFSPSPVDKANFRFFSPPALHFGHWFTQGFFQTGLHPSPARVLVQIWRLCLNGGVCYFYLAEWSQLWGVVPLGNRKRKWHHHSAHLKETSTATGRSKQLLVLWVRLLFHELITAAIVLALKTDENQSYQNSWSREAEMVFTIQNTDVQQVRHSFC